MLTTVIMMIVILESLSINLRVCYCVIVHEFRSENVNFVISKSNHQPQILKGLCFIRAKLKPDKAHRAICVHGRGWGTG